MDEEAAKFARSGKVEAARDVFDPGTIKKVVALYTPLTNHICISEERNLSADIYVDCNKCGKHWHLKNEAGTAFVHLCSSAGEKN